MQNVILRLTNLTLQREEVSMVDGLSWSVQQGENWVILGPNGCGKTSLLKCLLGYLPASSGEMEVLGKSFGQHDWRELRLRLGLVSSSLQASIPPREEALNTVISGRYAQLDLWHKVSKKDQLEARRWLEEFQASRLASRPWAVLSQGERQKVLICRALMGRPSLLILDEPCAGLDPLARAEFLGFLTSLARHKDCPALVLVTHHVEEILPCFTHVLLMKKGRAHAQGPVMKTLSAKNLSGCFEAPMPLRRMADGAYSLRLPPQQST